MERQLKEAIDRCLNCKNKPCSNGCPVGTDIPSFIANVKNENWEEAYNILQNNNPLSSICSRVCYQEEQCQGNCVRGIKGEAVSIGILEQTVNDWAKENLNEKIHKRELSGKVAVIGSGPAGLTVAHELIKEGIGVTVFEKEEKLGGILQYGIPDYRLPKYLIDDVINKLENMGVIFKTGIELGKDITINGLRQQGYEEIFLGIGSGIPSTYNLNGKNVITSNAFLKKYHNKENLSHIENIIVIGGGNVATDCARTAKRMGAKNVTIAYRRNREKMPANKNEIEECIKEGIKINFLTKVIDFDDKNIKCIKTELEDGKVIDIENTEHMLPANMVIFAIGLSPDKKLLEQTDIALDNGILCVDETGMTKLDGIYAGGDLTEKKSTVVRAVASGKRAANGILNRRKNNA